MSKEGEAGGRLGSEPLFPTPLTPDLAAFLQTQEIACLMHETSEGTAFVVKLPAAEIESVRGTVPMAVRHELYRHPAAPVIRTVVTIFDQPERPLALETFTNIDSPDQRADFAGLGKQRELLFFFYDEMLSHRLSKRTGNVEPEVIAEIVRQAQQERQRIPDERFDFDRAKADLIARTRL